MLWWYECNTCFCIWWNLGCYKCNSTRSTEVRGDLTFWNLCFRLCFAGVFSRWIWATTLVGGVADFKMENGTLLVVSRGSTRSEKMQITDLLSGTMRRISRARSIVSGVELWHPAKPLLENRVVFVHCIIMTACSCHHATLHLSIVIILHLLA